jgi:hypothetical protein
MVQKVTQMAYVLLNASKAGEVALGYDADTKRAHRTIMTSLS